MPHKENALQVVGAGVFYSVKNGSAMISVERSCKVCTLKAKFHYAIQLANQLASYGLRAVLRPASELDSA